MNVVTNISSRLARWCCPMAESAEYEAICYGIELIIETLYKNGIALIFGWIAGCFTETLVILIVLKLLRIQAGGGHAASGIRCAFYTVGTVIFGAVFCEYWTVRGWELWGIYGFSLIIFGLWAPSCTINNPIDDPVLVRRKKICALLMVSIGFVLTEAGIFAQYSGLITYSIVIEVLSVIMNEIKNRRIFS